MGLGSPMSRFVCAALASGLVTYTLKVPMDAFREDGTLRPAGQGSAPHFLLIPLTVGTAVYLFT